MVHYTDKVMHSGGKLGLLDVFSGMGALSYGFERAGFVPLLAMEQAIRPANAYALNRPEVPVLVGNCLGYEPADLRLAIGSVTAVIGGVPCEPFSRARGLSDEKLRADSRQKLIGYAMRLVAAFRPQAFVFENIVPALNSMRWRRAAAAAESAGYGVSGLILSADDHGAPTSRKRAFLIGVLGRAAIEASDVPAKAGKTIGQAVADLGPASMSHADPLHRLWLKLPPAIRRAARRAQLGSLLRPRDAGSHPIGFTVRLLDPDRPASTITSGSPLNFVHWSRTRTLTAREAARAQGIPDSYKLGVSSVSAAFAIIGDCVPVPLAESVAHAVARRLADVAKASADLTQKELDAALAVVADGLETFDKSAPDDIGASEQHPQLRTGGTGAGTYADAASKTKGGKSKPRGHPNEALKVDPGAYLAKVADQELSRQAERAEREDKLTLGGFFYQPKPTRAAFPEQPQSVESLVVLFEARADELLPTFVQKKYDGVRVQVHRDRDKVLIISEDGDKKTARLPSLIEELLALRAERFVLDAEIERWDGKQHLPREAAAGYLNSKGPPDDRAAGVVVNVFDALYLGGHGDIHGWPLWRRLEKLVELGIIQSTMQAPDSKLRLNLAPSLKIHTAEELERATRRIRTLPGSEGIVAKQADSPYPLKRVTPGSWVKFHNSTVVRGVVHGREGVSGAPSTWVYQWGVLPGRAEPTKLIKVGEREIHPVGDTFNTSLEFKIGDTIVVEGETLNLTKRPEGVEVTVWVPRVIGPTHEKPDTIEAAVTRARANLVLAEKEIDADGEITYTPTSKQEDPYLEIPAEEGRYRYIVHQHWRGKGVHSDLRIVLRPGKLLVGWTMNTQIEGAIKSAVLTLGEARRLAREAMDRYSKINWNTGEWATRPKAGTPKLVRATIQTQRKAPEPFAWINVEGKTKDPAPGEPPPVGGTRSFPGVFLIAASGEAEYGAQKPWSHEYFLHGDLNHRLFFRLLRLAQKTLKGLPSLCIACKLNPAAVDTWWADRLDSAASLCLRCLEWPEVDGTIVGLQKVELPPSEAPEESAAVGGESWFAIRPDDPRPNVLSPDEVRKRWMPPLGVSALPRATREAIPDEFRYWKKGSAEGARAARDALVQAIADKSVEIDFAEPYKRSRTKVSLLDARFVLQRQTYRGPVQIRVGPSRTIWWLRLDIGRPELLTAELFQDPVGNVQLAALVSESPRKTFGVEGEIPPGTLLNPTKETPSFIERVDEGKARVLSVSDTFIKIDFDGSALKGLFTIRRADVGAEEWLWERSQPGPRVVKVADGSEPSGSEASIFVPIIKVDADHRLVTGIVLEPDEVDAQNDTLSSEAIEKAAFSFLASFGKTGGTRLGVMHRRFGDVGLELVESWVARDGGTVGGEKVKRGSWLMTVHVVDDTLWARVKRGEFAGFSIGGVAVLA